MATLTARHRFVCTECGETSAKWLGRCPGCDSWDSLREVVEKDPRAAGVAPVVGRRFADLAADTAAGKRVVSGLAGVDTVLGGGVVPGSSVLLAGEPGIGKSTLLLQLASRLGDAGARTLYVSAEESPQQVRMRAERLGAADTPLLVAGESEIEPLLATLAGDAPAVLLVDSIQAVRSADLPGPPGSIAQVRFCAERLIHACKRHEVSLFLVGHVTKEGDIAGPKSLEHLVDVVLTFDGERETQFRLLRAAKNRFGSTGEVALFEMREAGLVLVSDPSRILLTRQHGQAPGSVVLPSLQGTRPLLVEIQALVNPSPLPTPRRMSVGLDGNRVALLTAVLERFAGLRLADKDLFLNVVGGLAPREPAADLAVATAILSAARDRPAPADAVYFGEVGLLGEVRPVGHTASRLRAAQALGFRAAVAPETEAADVPNGIRLLRVRKIADLVRIFDLPGR
ncbi:MAG: DNA repair protein RadA [Thermoanaerobaculia bacterium]